MYFMENMRNWYNLLFIKNKKNCILKIVYKKCMKQRKSTFNYAQLVYNYPTHSLTNTRSNLKLLQTILKLFFHKQFSNINIQYLISIQYTSSFTTV